MQFPSIYFLLKQKDGVAPLDSKGTSLCLCLPVYIFLPLSFPPSLPSQYCFDFLGFLSL